MRSLIYLLLLASCIGSMPKDSTIEVYLRDIKAEDYMLYNAEEVQYPLQIDCRVEQVDKGIKKLNYTIVNEGENFTFVSIYFIA